MKEEKHIDTETMFLKALKETQYVKYEIDGVYHKFALVNMDERTEREIQITL